MTTIFDRALYGFRFVDTLRDDTLQEIAARELGDAARWPELIAYNKLVPPFLVNDEADRAPGVAVVGDQLLVPAPAPAAETTVPNEVFGIDMKLEKNGMLSLDGSDFATVGGADNYKQALKNAVDTDRGELLFHQRYGCQIRRLIGTVNRATAGLMGSQYVRATVRDDPRTRRVNQAVADIAGDVISIRVDAEAVNGQSVSLKS